MKRDAEIGVLCAKLGVTVSAHATHTLHDIQEYIRVNKNVSPSTFRGLVLIYNIAYSIGFVKLFGLMPAPRKPMPAPLKSEVTALKPSLLEAPEWNVPTLADMGFVVCVFPCVSMTDTRVRQPRPLLVVKLKLCDD